MYDFSSLTNNLEGSSVGNIVIIALLSFVLSSIIAIVYEKTSLAIERPRYFIQSLILISIPVATVMQAIGDSLARGLGMLGALAIIRFRTTLTNPRNMVFMFASITVGIATGVYGIAISLIGTFGFCMLVLLLHFSSLRRNKYIVGVLQFEIPNEELISLTKKDQINATINSYCKQVELVKYGITKKRKETSKGITAFEYKIKIEDGLKATQLANELTRDGLLNIKIIFKEYHEKL